MDRGQESGASGNLHLSPEARGCAALSEVEDVALLRWWVGVAG